MRTTYHFDIQEHHSTVNVCESGFVNTCSGITSMEAHLDSSAATTHDQVSFGEVAVLGGHSLSVCTENQEY